jgi:hypothetical protein
MAKPSWVMLKKSPIRVNNVKNPFFIKPLNKKYQKILISDLYNRL